MCPLERDYLRGMLGETCTEGGSRKSIGGRSVQLVRGEPAAARVDFLSVEDAKNQQMKGISGEIVKENTPRTRQRRLKNVVRGAQFSEEPVQVIDLSIQILKISGTDDVEERGGTASHSTLKSMK